MNPRKGKQKLGSVSAKGGSKRNTVGAKPGGAQGCAQENAAIVGTPKNPAVVFAHPVKTTG